MKNLVMTAEELVALKAMDQEMIDMMAESHKFFVDIMDEDIEDDYDFED